MKPSDLKAPFRWSERRPVICDGVFFVPEFFAGHSTFPFPGWASKEIFHAPLPIRLEFCSGNGHWLAARAQNDLTSNWVGVEKRLDRARKLWSKGKNLSLKNLFVVCGEAYTFCRWYIPADSVEEVFINFPDPWPKRRHEKHRLIKPPFLDELARVLKRGGKFTFVTDDIDYRDETSALLKAHPTFVDLGCSTSKENYGTSYFDALWREKGKDIYYLEYQRLCN